METKRSITSTLPLCTRTRMVIIVYVLACALLALGNVLDELPDS